MPHNHQDCIKQAFDQADSICAEQNARFTPLRKRVLELLWNSHKPAKAYDILDTLRLEDKSAKPSTIYRTLEFLQELGLAHKVDSMNAYIGCSHPDQRHHCQFLICRICGDSREFCASDVLNAINEHAHKQHFTVERHIIEVHGVCGECIPPVTLNNSDSRSRL
jgi:Fur family transcriptional regulator, zinc uptake regulator